MEMEMTEPHGGFREPKPFGLDEIAFGIANFVFTFGGLILVAMSGWLLQAPHRFLDVDNDNVTLPVRLLIFMAKVEDELLMTLIAGLFLFASGALGCIGAIRISDCMRHMYGFIMVVSVL